MSKTKILLLLAIGELSSIIQARAQSTNPAPATALELVETTPGNLVLKSSLLIGSVDASPIAIQVTCKQDDVINPTKNTRQTFYGCSLKVTAQGQTIAKTLIDADEMNSLLQAIGYIKNVNWSMVPLPAFDLTYSTKAGLTVSGFSSKRNGTIEFSLRNSTMEKSILLTPDQVGQLYTLLENTKTKIDSLRKG